MGIPDTTGLGLDDDEMQRRSRIYGQLGPSDSAVGPVIPPTQQPSPRIAAPSANDKTPPVTLRGITPQLQQRTASDEAEAKRIQDTGSGISQIQHGSKEGGIGIAKPHPFWGGLLRGLDVAGSIIAPGIDANIPGTELHHQLLGQGARGRLGADIEEQEKQAVTAKDLSDADSNKQQAALTRALLTKGYTLGQDASGAPELQDIPGFRATGTPDEQTFAALLKETNPETGKMYTPFEAHQKLIAGTTEGKRVPVGDPSAQQYNASILRELNVNPKTKVQAVPPEYRVTANDTDAEAKEKLQRAKDLVSGATGQERITVQTGNQGNARSDKSFQFNSTQLEKARKPIDDTVQRLGRLQNTLAQHNPQADALVGPELLSVMSGGQGSGLRMNEAEIQRIVGGRSAWENLKAAFQHWSTKPEDARSITPDQDKQIRALVDTVHQKLLKKQAILDEANQSLLESDDVKQHRQIVAGARQKLDAIDSGGGGGGQNSGAGKTLSMSAIQQAAKENGVSVDEAKRQAQAAGYTIQ